MSGFIRYNFFIVLLSLCLLCFSLDWESEASGGRSRVVKGVRSWSNPTYTRVVIDVSGGVSFKYHLLKEDPSIKKPRRLFLDIKKAMLPKDARSVVPINDGLLKRVRLGQHDKETVRVVLDIESIEDYKVIALDDPFRIVVDVTGKASGERDGVDDEGSTLVQQLGLKVSRIVIDPGHGGKDPGAIGSNGLKEKDVNLKLAKRLKRRLKEYFKGDIILTRKDDRYIPLEERTAIANTNSADLFVSLHVNASPNPRAMGVETYYLNYTTDKESIRVAARENATSTRNISDLQFILNDLIKTAKTNESVRLAANVQETLVSTLKARYSKVNSNGIKGAPFYVLVGTRMPSVLVEVSFISNPKEEARLRSGAYLDTIAKGIARGLSKYIKDSSIGINEL